MSEPFFDITPFLRKHVVYLVRMNLTHPVTGAKIDYLKPGYTADIAKRLSSLRASYKTTIHVVDVRLVKDEQTEKEFHSMLQKKYAAEGLHQEIVVGGKPRTEMYLYDDRVIDQFKTFDFLPATDVTDAATMLELKKIELALIEARIEEKRLDVEWLRLQMHKK